MIRRLTTTIALAVAVHQIDTLRRSIMTIRDDIAAVTGQLGKARDEILGKLAELEQKIVDGTVTAEDLAPLKAAAQSLDDVVPDPTPAPEPEPETPGEPETPAE